MKARDLGVLAAAVSALAACGKERPAKVPGETDVRVVSIELTAPGGGRLALDHDALPMRLGLRTGNVLVTDRYYNPYRLAEDRRRIAAFWQTFGYFEVDVAPPVVTPAPGGLRVAWTVREGQRYTIGEVHVLHAPQEHAAHLESLVPFAAGERRVDLEAMRKVRHALADVLRRDGYGHATVYSRTYVDRTRRELAWYYLVDAGPKTHVGKIVVQGAVKVTPAAIVRRTGFDPGGRYDLQKKERAEADLIDTGSFASAQIRANTDTEILVPGDAPDTGGVTKPEQIGPDGDLVPRRLDPAIDLTIVVVEAPTARLRVKGAFEVDPSRADATLGADVTLRNLFGGGQHLTLGGRLGYGVLFDHAAGSFFDARGEPSGLFGEALARYDHAGLFGRLLDARVTARYRDVLYPGFHLRELTVGPGVRTTFTKGLFLDVDAYARVGEAVDFGPFDAATRARFSLPASDAAKGAELDAGLVWDGRDDPIEPKRGAFAALRGQASPGGPLGTNGYATVLPDVRGFVPLSASVSIGARASGGFVVWKGAAGVPLGPRLFGGGPFGMRGFGRDELSPIAACAPVAGSGGAAPCALPVGGLSLYEASLEARWLPVQKFYGATLFADLGAAGATVDPFDVAPSFAAGVGLRLRLWYLPIAFDFAYRFVDKGAPTQPSDVPLLVFFRVGEAF